MFEHLTLENLQCGLSWLLVMRKRDIFGSVLITSITTRLLPMMMTMWSAS